MDSYVIGIDFGTDSVRSVIINANDGTEIASAVSYYSRWKRGEYCDASSNQFRQHPLDYIEGLESSIQSALSEVSDEVRDGIKGIAVDTTGSTPVAVNREGIPLALLPEFEENPNAMFILWKDHTAIKEADEINDLCVKWSIDYSKYSGGIYSSEWFWAKILRTLRIAPEVRNAAFSWVEHCDWIPFLLTGGQDVLQMKRSRCAAGHKALWHTDFDGLPSQDFLTTLDPLLSDLRKNLFEFTYTSDTPAGHLSPEWAQRLGLSAEVVVAVGAFDAHMGAVGGQIEPYYLSKVMGTSTCDVLVAPRMELEGKLVRGICGQVDGSVLPDMVGLEAGQSAFGDVYAWFQKMLFWPFDQFLSKSELLDEEIRTKLLQEGKEQILSRLSEAAAEIAPEESAVIALDWLNGRRTPDANQALKGALWGITLGTDAPRIFRALVEATCFGARKIVERFQDEGVPIKGVIGLGGVARKSPFIMQMMADVLNRPLKIARSEQTCALGAAMFAATAAGLYDDVSQAMKSIGAGFDVEYHPNADLVATYDSLYRTYCQLGTILEEEML